MKIKTTREHAVEFKDGDMDEPIRWDGNNEADPGGALSERLVSEYPDISFVGDIETTEEAAARVITDRETDGSED